MINLKKLRKVLEIHLRLSERVYIPDKEITKDRITIKRKKKMILVKNLNGDIKTKRVNYIKIEIIE